MDAAAVEIRALARPLATPADLDPLLARTRSARYVCIGEASHGTHEYYRWRARAQPPADRGAGLHLDRCRGRLARLLADQPVGPWPRRPGSRRPRAARPVRTLADLDVGQHRRRRVPRLAARTERHPSGGGAGRLLRAGRVLAVGLPPRDHGLARPTTRPTLLADARRAWQCFAPFGEDPHEYAWSTRLVPETCEGGRGRVAGRGAGARPATAPTTTRAPSMPSRTPRSPWAPSTTTA